MMADGCLFDDRSSERRSGELLKRDLLKSADPWQVFASIGDYAFILTNEHNDVVEWSQGGESLLGYSRAEILGKPASQIFTPEDREADVPRLEMETALRDGRAEDERWHLRKDGSRFRASGVMAAVRDDAGDVIGFAKVLRDVTEREEAREELERSLCERVSLLRELQHRVPTTCK